MPEKTDTSFKGTFIMKEMTDGKWAFVHHPQLPPVTMKEIDWMIQYSKTNFILISKPEVK